MSKKPKRGAQPGPAKVLAPVHSTSTDFDEVIRLIEAARTRVFSAINKELIELYWQIGEYISRKISDQGWGKGTVETLSDHIQRSHPGISGFSTSNLWRMRQFFEIYR